jgi:4-diphosphocytidyl-2-C-methyl-D-erythritol kinase
MTIDLLAYAKLNLSLRVLAQRPDGYHEIDSLVQTIDLADHIRISVTKGDALHVANDLEELEGPDLAHRAAAALLAAKKTTRKVSIEIQKHIPVGAGLGGGSSDAAAVLQHLDLAMPPRLSADELHTVAARIGSDVPLFLAGGCVRLRGRGERLDPCLEPRTETFVVLVPPIHCSTATVYGAWRTEAAPSDAAYALGANDLLLPALATHPGLLPYHQAISSSGGAFTGMSGSGSAFYAAFLDPAGADKATRALQGSFPQARAFACRPTTSGSCRIDEGGRT